ncbi:MAG: hypothetical protein GY794_10685 [bacterium]|nr:hypothetical protein [bacterium]
MQKLYDQRLNRYTTAMKNGKPDMVPIRPFVAEFTAKYAGFTCQDVSHDYEKAFEAARICAADFDWDAVVGNMVYVWTGLTQAIGLNYYATPGIDIDKNTGFQYLEPPEGQAFMGPDEYDALIDDPTGFLYNVWLPRVCNEVVAPGEASTYRNNLSFVKGAMGMMQYFGAFGVQAQRLREESGTVSAIAGILKAPLDILADKLRGYVGLITDMVERPKKVLAACEALAPHLLAVAMGSSDPTGTVPIGFWMHRSCVPFISPGQFEQFHWPTLKPIIQELWGAGRQTLFYAEGNWNRHLDAFAELPDASIVYHVDNADIFEVHRKIGHKFCLSGGIPTSLLAYGTAEQVRQSVKEVIEGVAQDGGYILDASAIVQNAATIENMKVMTDAAREYGAYSSSSTPPEPGAGQASGIDNSDWARSSVTPGVCLPWDQKKTELPTISGDEALVKTIWENVDALGNMYIWQCLLSF